MAIKDLLEHLHYSKCDCGIEYDEASGEVIGACMKHKNSVLMVKGIRVGVFLRELEKRKFDKAVPKIV